MQTELTALHQTGASGWRRAVSLAFGGFAKRMLTGRAGRRLKLSETLSLGNRGYVAVVKYGDQQFLIGGTNSSITLLANLSRGFPGAQEKTENEST
jgi:flagellar biogenesis protein FliO